MKIKLTHSQQKFLFLFIIAATYTAALIHLQFLQGPIWYDEGHYWETSLTFSHHLIPTIEDLKDYRELNTPLPFIIFGILEYLFHQGMFGGRLLNMILSLVMVFMIGWPSRDKGGRAILCLIGLLFCRFYLLYGLRFYTEIISCFFVLIGFMLYFRDRYLLSCISLILAIACRQYMIAFPAAIVTYEFMIAMIKVRDLRRINLAEQWRWLAPLVAVLSIFIWIYLFQGLAPQSGIDFFAPEVQKTIWAVNPGNAINFLGAVAIYIVIPEFILFSPLAKLKKWQQDWQQQWRKIFIIAVALFLYVLFFPPALFGAGEIIKVASLLQVPILKTFWFYSLALLSCLRFFQPNLMSMLVLFNCLIMIKALAWTKYVLPLAVVFWYFKSLGFEEKSIIFKQQNTDIVPE